MLEFYKLLNVETDEEMAKCLGIGIEELQAILKTGSTPWELLVPALLEAGIGVDIYVGNMLAARACYPDKSVPTPRTGVVARVTYNQMLELRRKRFI
jgi:hypothetical protein